MTTTVTTLKQTQNQRRKNGIARETEITFVRDNGSDVLTDWWIYYNIYIYYIIYTIIYYMFLWSFRVCACLSLWEECFTMTLVVQVYLQDEIDWLVGWLIDWLTDWLVGWLIDWLVGWLTDWLVDWLIDWLVNWLIGWLVGWLTDWLVDWLIEGFIAPPTTQGHLRACKMRVIYCIAYNGRSVGRSVGQSVSERRHCRQSQPRWPCG